MISPRTWPCISSSLPNASCWIGSRWCCLEGEGKVGVHHKNQPLHGKINPKDWQVIVPWWCRVSPLFLGLIQVIMANPEGTPWKINGWNLQNHPFRTENDQLQTSMIDYVPAVNLQGCKLEKHHFFMIGDTSSNGCLSIPWICFV